VAVLAVRLTLLTLDWTQRNNQKLNLSVKRVQLTNQENQSHQDEELTRTESTEMEERKAIRILTVSIELIYILIAIVESANHLEKKRVPMKKRPGKRARQSSKRKG
jgi:hypothetical protein